MIDTADFRNGMNIMVDGEPFTIIWFQHHKPGKGGAVVRVKIKSLRSGSIIERSFKSGERFPDVELERNRKQFLYREGDSLHFMDMETFDQVQLEASVLGEGAKLLKENMGVEMVWFQGRILETHLPTKVDLAVVETEPGARGDTVNMPEKPARLETGAIIKVPLFIKTGDLVRVDTRTGQYVERV